MKKILILLLSALLLYPFCFSAYAENGSDEYKEIPQPAAKQEEQTTQDMSTPRLMVTAFTLDTKELTPDKASVLKITLHNFSETKSLRNIKLSIIDESGQIEIEGMGTKHLNRIYVGSDYVWEVKLKPLPTAEIGKHSLTVTSEYEDLYYSSFSMSDTIDLTVKQSVSIAYNGITIPEKIVEGETNTMTVTIMNTGKTDIRNCRIILSSDTVESAGTTFVGEIAAGESANATVNYKQQSGKTGKVSLDVKIVYEDVFGNEKSENVTLTSVAEKKVELAQKAEEEKKSENPLWWLFLLIGFAAGGGMGFGIPWLIKDKKQRKEDDLRL